MSKNSADFLSQQERDFLKTTERDYPSQYFHEWFNPKMCDGCRRNVKICKCKESC